MPLPE
jgi:hypothetical protein